MSKLRTKPKAKSLASTVKHSVFAVSSDLQVVLCGQLLVNLTWRASLCCSVAISELAVMKNSELQRAPGLVGIFEASFRSGHGNVLWQAVGKSGGKLACYVEFYHTSS